MQVTSTLENEIFPPENNAALRQVQTAKYLDLHLNQRLTWETHLLMKGNQLRLLIQLSKLSLENKFLVYRAIVKPFGLVAFHYRDLQPYAVLFFSSPINLRF